MLDIVLAVEPNIGEQMYLNIFDQLWGWAFTASGGRAAGAIIILGIVYKVFETFLLRMIDKVKKGSKKTKRQVRK